MKGIILAGGSGTRLLPMTACVNKHLLPVYDKPMIYYPLATLMQAGIRDILLITTPADQNVFKNLLGDGAVWGLNISYAIQEKPAGISQAFLIGEEFIGGDACTLILGDNIFYGAGFEEALAAACRSNTGATVFAKQVSDPQRFGVVELNAEARPIALVEKPKTPISNWAVTGVYVYNNQVVQKAKSLKPSARGELEITDLNQLYLEEGSLKVECLAANITWLDTGTPNSLLEASCFIRDMEAAHKRKIADLEEIAVKQGFIDARRSAMKA